MTGAREQILARIRKAAVPATAAFDDKPMVRRGSVELFAERLADYRANVFVRDELILADLLRDSTAVALPDDAPPEWAYGLEAATDLNAPGVTAITGCALAIAETGTIVLDAGRFQGARKLTLIPDHHVCIVHTGQIVADVPDAVAAIEDPTRPLTFISGPSATSDIELDRVEGVHGPRKLEVVIINPR